LKIRGDIYSWAKSREKEKIVQGLARLAFETFSGLFSSEDDVIKYINNFENPKIAERFLEIGEFYHFAKFYYCPNCFPTKRIGICPECKRPFELPAHIVFIMMISIMETLSLGLEDFVDFYDWVAKKETVRNYQTLMKSGEVEGYKNLVQSLRQSWSKEYGSITKVTDFFNNFLTKEEKVEFVKSIRYFRKVPELPPRRMGSIEGKTPEDAKKIYDEWKKTFEEEQQISFKNDEDVKAYVKSRNFKKVWEALPICFDEKYYWKCYGRYPYGQGLGYCYYVYKCRLFSDKDLLEECFEKTVKTIYDWRSVFVHEANLPPIREVAMLGGVYKGKSIIVELTTNKLKPVFEKMLKRYFDQHQRTN
jgi:rubrerythrin